MYTLWALYQAYDLAASPLDTCAFTHAQIIFLK